MTKGTIAAQKVFTFAYKYTKDYTYLLVGMQILFFGHFSPVLLLKKVEKNGRKTACTLFDTLYKTAPL